jgi:sugar lactone lactonase YvrE
MMRSRLRPMLLLALTASCAPRRGPSAPTAAAASVRVVAAGAELGGPFAVAFDRARRMYVAGMYGHRVTRVERDGRLTAIAGTGEAGGSGDGGPARAARLDQPHHLIVAPNDDVYVADTANFRVRKIDARTGVISTVAGSGRKGYAGDGGPALAADFGGIYCLAADPGFEALYLADLDNRRVRMVRLSDGVVTTVAGNGARGTPPDGADARAAPLSDPRAVAVDSHGNLYIIERGGHALRVVDRLGKIRTVVGTGEKGFTGDGADARMATLNGPKHLAIDRNDDVLIADTENHAIRRYSPRDGRIVRALGGPGDPAGLQRPHGVFVGPDGAMYVADSDNGRVLRFGP